MSQQLALIPNLFTDLPPDPPLTADQKRDARILLIRQKSAPAMQCKHCRRDLWITSSGFLVCSDTDLSKKSCSRLLSLRSAKSLVYLPGARKIITDKDFCEAWADRVIVARS